MKSFALLLCSILFCCTIWGQTANSEKEVRSVIQKMEDAWNAHDYSYTGNNDIFDANAVVINPVGMYWKNKTDIVKALQTFGNVMFKYESSKYSKVDVRFLAPQVALVTIQSKDNVDQDYTLPGGGKSRSKGETGEGMMGLTLVKKTNNWKITSMQITYVDQNAAAFNPIK